MSGGHSPGDIKVSSADQQSMWVHGRGQCHIFAGGNWHEMKLKPDVDPGSMTVIVRLKAADFAGMPYPTGVVFVHDPVPGWRGHASVS